jgi:hypothetical protein
MIIRSSVYRQDDAASSAATATITATPSFQVDYIDRTPISTVFGHVTKAVPGHHISLVVYALVKNKMPSSSGAGFICMQSESQVGSNPAAVSGHVQRNILHLEENQTFDDRWFQAFSEH